MGIVRDLYYARKMSAGLKLPAPTVALLIKRLRLAAAMGGDITKTVSGTMVHITDALAKAALSVLASIEPIQDLHGYANPWPGGGGANILDPDKSSRYSTTAYGMDITYLGDDTFTIKGQSTTTSASAGFNVLRYSDTSLSGFGYVVQAFIVNDKSNNYKSCYGFRTSTEKEIAVVLDCSVSQDVDITIKFSVATASQASWTPYANICPISGLTGLSVYRTGKNLLNQTNEKPSYYETDSDGAVTNTNTTFSWGYVSSCFKSTLPAGDYTLIVIAKTANGASCNTQVWPSVGSRITAANNSNLVVGGKVSVNFTLSEATDIGVCFKSNGGYNWVMIVNRADSSLSTFEPYQGNTYAVDWSTQADTVYGGTVDVVSGELTVDMVNIPSYNGETINEPWLSSMDAYAAGTTPTIGAQVVYTLATPLTYQLSAQEVQMLLGENNVWASSGDTVSVTYYAEGNANPLQSLNILLGGRYSNPKTADDVSDKEALEIILGGNK